MNKLIKSIMLVGLVTFFGCGELQEVTIEGLPGAQGPKGDKGDPGVSCTITGTAIVCTDGSSLDLEVFQCTVERVGGEYQTFAQILDEVESRESGVIVTCGDSEVFIRDGIDGRNGQDGENGQDGSDGQDGEDGSDGSDGQDGENGEDGKSCGSELRVVNMPVRGGCYSLGNGLWAENEGGDKADLYNNLKCAHSGGNKRVICDNMHSDDDFFGAGEVCAIEDASSIFLLEGSGSSMQMFILDFSNACEDEPKSGCNNGNGNGSEGCSSSDNGNNDED